MTDRNFVRAAAVAAAVIGLAGCDSIKDTFGMNRHVPDESQVVARPALTLPPDYTLRPPGTATAVSAAHETVTAQGANGEPGAAQAPVKERPGFFGRLFNGEMLGLSSDDDSSAAPASPPPANPPAPAAATSSSAAGAATPVVASAQPAPAPQGPPKEGYIGAFFSDMGSLFGIGGGDKQAANAAPVAASAQPVAAAPPAPEKPGYVSSFFSDMGSLFGIGGGDKKKDQPPPANNSGPPPPTVSQSVNGIPGAN